MILLMVISLALLTACSADEAPPAEERAAAALQAESSDESIGEHLPTWDPPTAEFVADAIRGLAFDEFLNTAYRLLLMRFPQTLSDLGLAEMFGVRNDRLNDYSEAYELETQRIEREILTRLRSYDRASLSADQQLTYDICEWHLADVVRGHEFALYSHPVSQYFITSLGQQLLDAMTVAHPFRTAGDVEDYMTRLEQVDDQVAQIIAAIERRADEGIIVPRVMIDWALGNLEGLAASSVQRHPLYATLEEKSHDVGLPGAERERLLEEARVIMADHVLPVYQALHVTMQSLRVDAPDEIGFGQYDGGADYYAYALRHQNQTMLTPQEVHDLGLREVARLRGELQQAAVDLGMPEGLSLAEIYQRAGDEGGSVSGEAIVAEYERLLKDAKRSAVAVFERVPAAEVVVIPDPIGGYYRPAAADGSRPAQFAASNQGSKPKYRMATLTYHETIPGHHLQIALSQELDLPLLRSIEHYLGYTEGWALYSEELAWELGWYDDNPYGNIGRLSDQMMRAVRLVVDTGIHVFGWSFDRATEYFAEHTGRPYGESQYNILRYAAWPGQSTAYMVGRLEILRLRARAQEALGEAFDLTEFHSAVLEDGSVPLEILGRLIDEYIDGVLAQQEG